MTDTLTKQISVDHFLISLEVEFADRFQGGCARFFNDFFGGGFDLSRSAFGQGCADFFTEEFQAIEKSSAGENGGGGHGNVALRLGALLEDDFFAMFLE